MAALRRRDSAAAKLKDSVRQLRRYLDNDNCTERLLTQKLDKVDLDREELIAKHHEYVEKTDDVNLDDQEMTEFLTPKIDEAIDIVDEATNKNVAIIVLQGVPTSLKVLPEEDESWLMIEMGALG